MAVIKLYKYFFDTETYESDQDVVISDALHTKYRESLYTTNIYPISIIRAKYGDDYVDVYEAEIDIDWKPVDWSQINGMSAVVTNTAQ